jgi:hypothetical protein
LTPADLSPELAQKGYTVTNGRLNPPRKDHTVPAKKVSRHFGDSRSLKNAGIS